MGLLKEEDMFENLDFECKRCGTSCVKSNALEPDYGYISTVDGSWVGPLCNTCISQVGDVKEVNKVMATVFTIAIRSDGDGIIISDEDGEDYPYIRKPTTYDIITACQYIADDLKGMRDGQRAAGTVSMMLSQAAQQKGNMVKLR